MKYLCLVLALVCVGCDEVEKGAKYQEHLMRICEERGGVPVGTRTRSPKAERRNNSPTINIFGE